MVPVQRFPGAKAQKTQAVAEASGLWQQGNLRGVDLVC